MIAPDFGAAMKAIAIFAAVAGAAVGSLIVWVVTR